MSKKLDIVNIAADNKQQLKGFKILGVNIPFYFNHITVRTHIQLCGIKEQIQQLSKKQGDDDFYNSKLQGDLFPLTIDYCTTALCNNRKLSFIIRQFIKHNVKQCSHSEILNLYMMILKMNEPAFFLTYWKWVNQKENTVLQAAKQ